MTNWPGLPVDRYRKDCGPISPDGQWVLFSSAESGRPAVYVQRFPEGQAHAVSPGTSPRWSPAGDEIYFFDQD